MADYSIVQAGWRDLNELRKIEKECFLHDSWPLWDLVAVLTLPGIIRLKAVVGEEMVGFISGDIRPRESTGWITTLCVRESYRRQGIARALMAECEELMGMPKVRLSVRRTNWAALGLYEKLGFTQVTVWVNYYSGGEDALVLEKKR